MRKQLIAIPALALCAGFAATSTNVFATETDPFCAELSDGTQCFDTLQKAFDVVPTDNVQTTVYLNSTESTVNDGGAILRANQNVFFDLRGKTYNITQSTVGSTNTETLAFQLLKDSTIIFKNGGIVADAATAKIWLQNYATTTLEDMNLDATNYAQCMYVASNNNGSLTVKGKTNIIASSTNSTGAAFDLWYGMNSQGLYDDGVTVTFDETFTGRVKGNVEYGAQSKGAQRHADWRDLTELNIKGGTFDIDLKNGSTGALTADANINISGGTFTNVNNFNLGYISDGYMLYANANNTAYEVLPSISLSGIEPVYVNVGGTNRVKLPNGVDASAAMNNGYVASPTITAGSDYATADGQGVITGVAAGAATATINTTAVTDLSNGAPTGFLSATTPVNVVSEDTDNRVVPDSAAIDQENVPTEILGDLNTGATNEGLNPIGFFDITAKLVDGDGNPISDLSDLGHFIRVDFDFPANIPPVEEGYTRNFFMLRHHDGEVTKLPVTDNGDGTGSFDNDKFSFFILAYVDVVTVTPTSDDNNDNANSTTAQSVAAPGTGEFTAENTGAAAQASGFIIIAAAAGATLSALGIIVATKQHKD